MTPSIDRVGKPDCPAGSARTAFRCVGSACRSWLTLLAVVQAVLLVLPAAAQSAPPEDFRIVTLASGLDRPMQLEVAGDGRVYVAERRGALKVFDPATGKISVLGRVTINTLESEGPVGGPEGINGFALDPAFADNGWLYVFYAPDNRATPAKKRLSRFTVSGGKLDAQSEKVVLEHPVTIYRGGGLHAAGGLHFDSRGNLFIATGDNTYWGSGGFGPMGANEEDDALRTAGNTADLRGKILRIRPAPDGGYAIPDGNLFPKDGSRGRPEIFVMGCRNPFRIAVDPKTGWLLWGEVGPDARADDAKRGPRGYDEFNLASAPGNYGWPLCIADNKPYFNAAAGAAHNCLASVNTSSRNTGAASLPPAKPALIWYPYGESPEFPEMDSGPGRVAIAGPVYRYSPASTSRIKLPPQYDGSFFAVEWRRGFIKEVKLDGEGRLASIRPFRKWGPVDLKAGPDGALYGIEFHEGNLKRVEYTGPLPTAVGGAGRPEGYIPRLALQSNVPGADMELIACCGPGAAHAEPVLRDVTGKILLKLGARAAAFSRKGEVGRRWVWDGKAASGHPLPEGVYIWTLGTGAKALSRGFFWKVKDGAGSASVLRQGKSQ